MLKQRKFYRSAYICKKRKRILCTHLCWPLVILCTFIAGFVYFVLLKSGEVLVRLQNAMGKCVNVFGYKTFVDETRSSTGVQLKSGTYFNMSNLFTDIYNMLYYTTNLYLQ
jgi:hypothetical protein